MTKKHFNTAVESARRQHIPDTAGQGLLWAKERIAELEVQLENADTDIDDVADHYKERIQQLEAELERTINAIHQYMQTTSQSGPKRALVENFVGMYTYTAALEVE